MSQRLFKSMVMKKNLKSTKSCLKLYGMLIDFKAIRIKFIHWRKVLSQKKKIFSTEILIFNTEIWIKRFRINIYCFYNYYTQEV